MRIFGRPFRWFGLGRALDVPRQTVEYQPPGGPLVRLEVAERVLRTPTYPVIAHLHVGEIAIPLPGKTRLIISSQPSRNVDICVRHDQAKNYRIAFSLQGGTERRFTLDSERGSANLRMIIEGGDSPTPEKWREMFRTKTGVVQQRALWVGIDSPFEEPHTFIVIEPGFYFRLEQVRFVASPMI